MIRHKALGKTSRRHNRRASLLKSNPLILKSSLIRTKSNSINKKIGGNCDIPNLTTIRPSRLLQQIQNRCKSEQVYERYAQNFKTNLV
jgi:hypothetical protein